MNVLVIGSSGQLGQCFKDLKGRNPQWFFISRSNFDYHNLDLLSAYCRQHEIAVLINTAAYTQVDLAESNKTEAFAINESFVKKLVQLAGELSLSIIHFSTDYVFSGDTRKAYSELDEVNPKSVYGASKLAGEQALLRSRPLLNGAIIRTSWLFSEHGNNFVKTMLRLGVERAELKVVHDQYGKPTYARHLAAYIIQNLPAFVDRPVELYHYANEGVCSWYDFATEIMRYSKLECKVKGIPGSEYPTAAERPAYSALNTEKIVKKTGEHIPNWKFALHECLDKLIN